MTDINWGPEIATNGKRPEWLRDGDKIRWYGKCAADDWWEGSSRFTYAESISWDHDTHIRLPADHPHYSEDDVPDWAIAEALQRSGLRGGRYPATIRILRERSSIYSRAIMSFAELIAKHEQPPMDEVDRYFSGKAYHPDVEKEVREFLKWQKGQG